MVFGYVQMNERTIQAVPADDDEIVIRHSYPIRVQNAIIQNAISADGLKLTPRGRLNQATVIQILKDIEPIMGLGREVEKWERKREIEVYKLESMRKNLIALGVVKPDNGKLRVQEDAEIRPAQLFNQQLLPTVSAIFTNAMLMFTQLQFKPFVDFMSVLAEGQDASYALTSVSKHVRNPVQQSLVLSSVLSPLVLQPMYEIGLLINNPFGTTGLWDEVIGDC
jgi:hypothetical protein